MKKTFDENNPPIIETFGITVADIEGQKMTLGEAIEALDISDDEDEKLDILSAILEAANRISATDWDVACLLVKQNVVKITAPLDDGMVMDIIDIAIHDPQIQTMNKIMGIAKGYSFKSLADVPEIMSALPDEGALTLLDIAEGYAHLHSPVIKEIRGLRNAIDPTYQMPEGDHFDIH